MSEVYISEKQIQVIVLPSLISNVHHNFMVLCAKVAEKLFLGLLIGQRKGNIIEATQIIPIPEFEGKQIPSRIKLISEYVKNHMQVHSKDELIGWYSNLPLDPNLINIHFTIKDKFQTLSQELPFVYLHFTIEGTPEIVTKIKAYSNSNVKINDILIGIIPIPLKIETSMGKNQMIIHDSIKDEIRNQFFKKFEPKNQENEKLLSSQQSPENTIHEILFQLIEYLKKCKDNQSLINYNVIEKIVEAISEYQSTSLYKTNPENENNSIEMLRGLSSLISNQIEISNCLQEKLLNI